jgi:hypothetical protein
MGVGVHADLMAVVQGFLPGALDENRVFPFAGVSRFFRRGGIDVIRVNVKRIMQGGGVEGEGVAAAWRVALAGEEPGEEMQAAARARTLQARVAVVVTAEHDELRHLFRKQPGGRVHPGGGRGLGLGLRAMARAANGENGEDQDDRHFADVFHVVFSCKAL